MPSRMVPAAPEPVSTVMRALLFLTPVLLASCGSLVTQRDILARSRAEISAREAWSNDAVILVEKRPGDYRFTWLVRAGAMDYTGYPSWRGINLVPGTERNLRFTRDGCLIAYSETGSRCPRAADYAMPPAEAPPEDAK